MSKNWAKITFMTQNLNNIIILCFGTLPQTRTKSPGIITSYYYYLFLQWLLGTLSFPRMLHNTTSRVRDSNLFRKIIYIYFLIIALLNHRCTDDCPAKRRRNLDINGAVMLSWSTLECWNKDSHWSTATKNEWWSLFTED